MSAIKQLDDETVHGMAVGAIFSDCVLVVKSATIYHMLGFYVAVWVSLQGFCGAGSGDGTLHAWNINQRNEVACWNSYIGVVTCLKWAPRHALLAIASVVLTFWIPNQSKLDEEPNTAEAGVGK